MRRFVLGHLRALQKEGEKQCRMALGSPRSPPRWTRTAARYKANRSTGEIPLMTESSLFVFERKRKFWSRLLWCVSLAYSAQRNRMGESTLTAIPWHCKFLASHDYYTATTIALLLLLLSPHKLSLLHISFRPKTKLLCLPIRLPIRCPIRLLNRLLNHLPNRLQ